MQILIFVCVLTKLHKQLSDNRINKHETLFVRSLQKSETLIK
ncbi:hypothetical protein Syn1_150 [Prochlorococcus phage Syn1]|uniref:Uncharacterized protein n=1 Tax=Prochlorococcus phage Syn1 TaxID=444861 RepID=E3SPN5_9CAUD|nr:hypothetical protein Syn1_150 [Prochlorococcus phage Syn1]ADO99251.1 hypothetical protein Syn1_150 [Prochlorococcus phage Syn1]